MIFEVLISTPCADGSTHLAPMGVHRLEEGWLILPFRPSTTLDNLRERGVAVMNQSDDVRVFAGCLTGRRAWPLVPATRIPGQRLAAALAHQELRVVSFQDDAIRPGFLCETVHAECHRPFTGFNRAQAAVIEAAILASRWNRLPAEDLWQAMSFHQVAVDKTAGPTEWEAWTWLQDFLNERLGAP